MSNDSTNQNVEEQEIQKTVQVVAYLDYPKNMSMRQVANDMFPEVDWYDRHTWDAEKEVVRIGTQEFEVDSDLREAIEDADSGEIEADVVTKHKSRYRENINDLGKLVAKKMSDDMPDALLGEYELTEFLMKYRNDEKEDCLNLLRYAEKIPMVKEPDKIEGEDIYEDDVERPALKFKIKANADNEGEMDELQVMFIDQFVDMVGNRDDVKEVRWYNCKRKETTKGSCINI
jgi:hypothetical protein